MNGLESFGRCGTCARLHLGIAGGEDDRQVRPFLADRLGQLQAGHVRHRLIGDDQIDPLFTPRECRAPAGRMMPQAPVWPRSSSIATVLISTSASSSTASDDQRAACDLGPLRRCGRMVGNAGRRVGDRQPDLGGRAFAHAALQGEAAAGLLGQAVHHREAEAGALADALGGEERLRRARQRLRVHARRRCRSRERQT